MTSAHAEGCFYKQTCETHCHVYGRAALRVLVTKPRVLSTWSWGRHFCLVSVPGMVMFILNNCLELML